MLSISRLALGVSLLSGWLASTQAATLPEIPAIQIADFTPRDDNPLMRRACDVPNYGDCAARFAAGRCCGAERPECCMIYCSPREWSSNTMVGRGQCCTSGLFCAAGYWCIYDMAKKQQKCCAHANILDRPPCGITSALFNPRYATVPPAVQATINTYSVPLAPATSSVV